MSLRQVPLSDEAVERRLQAVLGGAPLDPLFGRRLRGILLNRHVAMREGLVSTAPTPGGRTMGRLGRACLLASVALAASVASAAAAAQESLPGDALHPFKLQIEEIRMGVAPVWMRDDLASVALAERLNELEHLLLAEEWARAQSAALAVQESAGQLSALDPTGGGVSRIEGHLATLQALIASAPEAARKGLAQALSAATAVGGGDPPGNAYGQQGESAGDGNLSNGVPQGNANGQADTGESTDTAGPDPTPSPGDPKETKKPRTTPKPGEEES